MKNHSDLDEDPPSPYGRFGRACNHLAFAHEKNCEFQCLANPLLKDLPEITIRALCHSDAQVQVVANLVAEMSVVLSEQGDKELVADILYLGDLAKSDLDQFCSEWKRKRSWFIAHGFMPQKSGDQFNTYASEILVLLDEKIDEGFLSLMRQGEFFQEISYRSDWDGGDSLTCPLTSNDRSILKAMTEIEATMEKPESAEIIVETALYRGDHKRAFGNLKMNGLVDSKRGRSGGYWLTKAGIRVASQLE